MIYSTLPGGMSMKNIRKTVLYDEVLHLEAYRLEGIAQPFPNHFHDYYVIGLVESGQRVLSCKNQEFHLQKGSLVLFNPGDSHACVQSDGGAMDYRGFNLSKEVMLDLTEELTGARTLPGFSPNVLQNEEATCAFRALHTRVLDGSCTFGKEEALLLLLSVLLRQCGQPFERCIPECPDEIEAACVFMEQHYAERLSLDQLCRVAGLSRSTLIRTFTRTKGVTPYSYLENIRIGTAKKLLEQGVLPVEAALRTGFSDQSHFTNYFSRFIGLAPGSYREIFEAKHATEGPLHEHE